MAQAVVVCYALFDPLFAAAMLVGCGEVDAEVHLDHLDQLSHECQRFPLNHFLDLNCVYLHIKLAAALAFPCSLFFHTTN
jgi:hypothetical protein